MLCFKFEVSFSTIILRSGEERERRGSDQVQNLSDLKKGHRFCSVFLIDFLGWIAIKTPCSYQLSIFLNATFLKLDHRYIASRPEPPSTCELQMYAIPSSIIHPFPSIRTSYCTQSITKPQHLLHLIPAIQLSKAVTQNIRG